MCIFYTKLDYVVCVSNVKLVLQALVQLTDNFPRHDPQNADLQQQLALVRAKFKQVSSRFFNDALVSARPASRVE